jgi:Response regulator containing a CheY-like receiver domain and a GGDEF domain
MRESEILLVEDNENDILLTKRALAKSNLKNEIIVARDGDEAIDYLFGNRAESCLDGKLCPVLVLLDIHLPKIDGLQVLKRIRDDERTHLCRVVILTSSKEEGDLIRSYQLGINSFIRKPVDFLQFAEAVSQVGLYWLVLNEQPPPEKIRRTTR